MGKKVLFIIFGVLVLTIAILTGFGVKQMQAKKQTSTLTSTLKDSQTISFDSANISVLNLSCRGCITDTNILDSSITGSDLAADAVGSNQLQLTAVSAGTYGDANNVAQFTVDADGRLTFAQNVAMTSSSSTSIAADSLNFTKFSDSLTLDANTVVSNSSFTLSFLGNKNYVFDSASIATLTITKPLIGTGVINSTNLTDGSISVSKLATDTLALISAEGTPGSDSIETAMLKDGAVTNAKMSAEALASPFVKVTKTLTHTDILALNTGVIFYTPPTGYTAIPQGGYVVAHIHGSDVYADGSNIILDDGDSDLQLNFIDKTTINNANIASRVQSIGDIHQGDTGTGSTTCHLS